ncbi:MAG: hypothetical protein JNM77_09285 [Pseudonocardia sp.]|nr:hypothetical protein [Pseudonocardia sp.]
MTDTATLITQLRVLAQLTRAEAHVARSRLVQASTDDIRDDLRRKAADADARAARIGDLLHGLGAFPDPVTPLVGRVASLVRGAMEQAQPLDEALLGDLALEHQLRDRARYVAELAGAAGLPAVHEFAVDLQVAHTETVEWLTGVLADLAGGQAALQASPLQRLAARVTRAANTPARPALGGTAATAPSTAERAGGTVTGAGAGVGTELAQTAGPPARHVPGAAAPDASPDLPSDLPPDAPDTGRTPPPIPDFADLPAHAAVAALRTLDDPRDVAATLEFEQEHGNRPGVVAAARLRGTALGAG